ncbi:hypothetical protein [Streptomyces sp. NBC_01615]|uniref:hypothetical protein n=1 Tax=Streptomyces sp. NBC_01615 TaxID=2975898 RepID=UPI003865625F
MQDGVERADDILRGAVREPPETRPRQQQYVADGAVGALDAVQQRGAVMPSAATSSM